MSKKFGKLLSVISLVLVMFVSLFALASCMDDGDVSGSASESIGASESVGESESSEESQKPTVKIALSAKTVTVEEYKSVTLVATVTGSDEEVVWASSDIDVATVDKGVVYGVKEGSATVTATIGEISAECSVAVTKTTVAPVLNVVDDISLEEGSSYKTVVKTLWDGEELGGIEYEWVLADEDSGVLEIVKGENGKVTFSALKAGEVVLTVKATVRGVFVSKEVKVKVIASVPSITPYGNIKAYEDGYKIDLCTLANEEKKVEEIVSFTASYKSIDIENAEITWGDWSTENVTKVEKVENGYKFSVLGAGEATVEGSYTFDDSTIAKVTVKVIVEKAVKTVEFGKVIDVTKDTSIEVPEGVEGEVVELTVGGNDVFSSYENGVITLNNSAFPKSAKELGANIDVVISTADCDYTCKADVYTLVIKTKEDFDAYPAIAKANGNFGVEGAKGVLLDGYFVLGNDIVYNGRFESPTDTGEIGAKGGRWNDAANNGFKGIFDGMGYNIEGLHVGNVENRLNEAGGFIGFLNNDGIVRNISFTNATVEENSGFICGVGSGLIENVSISFKALGVGNPSTNIGDENTYPPVAMGAFFSRSAREGATVKNCFVDASGADVKYIYNETKKGSNLRLGTDAGKNNVENLIIVADNQKYLTGSGASVTALTYDGLANEDCAKVVAALPSDYWTVVGNIPFLKRSADKIDESLQIEITVEGDVYAGTDVAVEINEKYSIVSAANLPEGVVFDSKMLKIDSSVVEGTTITIAARSVINGTTDEKTITVLAAGKEYTLEERLTIDLNATVEDGTAQSGAENIALDLSGVYKPQAESEAKVIIDKGEYVAMISAEGIVTFANPFDISKQGEYAVKVQVGRDVINANAIIVTKVVTTKEEFTALNTYAAAMNMGGYYMLGNDISVSELDAKSHQIGAKDSPFIGVIDGNGQKVTVWNFYDRTYGNGPWIFNFQGVIKNISLEFKYLAKYARIIRIGNGGTLENVYLSLKKTDYGDGAFMFQQSCGKMNLKNVVVDVTEITSASGYTIFGQATKVDGVVGGVEVMKATFTNVVVKTNSAFANSIGLENTDGVKSGIYVSFADTAATNGVDFPAEGWDETYWTVSNGSVTWKK